MVVLITAADTTGATGILHRETLTTGNDSIILPAGVIGKWLHAFTSTSNAQVGLSTTGTARTLVYDVDVTAGAGSVQAGMTVPAGVITPLGVVPKGATHLSWIGAAGASGKIEFYVSEAPTVA